MGKLRLKMQKALVTRHIHRVFDHYSPIHGTITGRITSGGILGGPVFIVDGIELSAQDLFLMIDMHEGWQFKLQFVDFSDEVVE